MDGLFCTYYRVSTVRQGESGLGLEAQRRAVTEFLNGGSWKVVGEFQEVESGGKDDRPALHEAIALCKLTGAKLLIAKLDRLSRDAHFLLGLEKQGIDFVACDMPHANRLTVGVMALVAQEEREAISRRTKAALGSIKARIENGETYVSKRSGATVMRLGNPNGLAVAAGSAEGVEAIKAKADAFASRVAPTARALLASEGSLARVARRLNEMQVKTTRGSEWTPMAVKRILDRTKPIEVAQ